METSRHFLRNCPAFARLRLKHLDSYSTFGEPGEKAVIDISRLKNFVADSKQYVDF